MENVPEFSEDEKQLIISIIDEIKIIDPACGSGAFPMGILQRLVYVLQKLDLDNKYWHELQFNKAVNESQEVFKQTDKNKREERLKEINDVFDESINFPDYSRKLYLIENCIYGVDIQTIAIQISKLRFFISLVIDQKIDKSRENFGIRPLPNLETKFVAANILIMLDETQHLANTDEVEKLKDEIKDIRHEYFYAKTRDEKLNCQRKDKELRELLAATLKSLKFSAGSAEKIANFDLFDQNTHADWFDPEWMFGVKDGFDIVIGNPPYIQLQKAFNQKMKYADLYKNLNYETFDRMGDIYCLFYERGMQLLKLNGHLCYISSNKWMRAGYGEKLRKFFLKYNPKVLVDLGPNVFESSTVDTNILLIQKSENKNKLKAVTINESKKNNINIAEILKDNGVALFKLSQDAWFIGSDAEQRLKEKIERIGKPLKDWNVNIYYGIKTGLNEAFIIDNAKREEILKNCRDAEERKRTEAIIKPILRGRDIKRYYYEWAGLWVIIIPAGRTNENRGRENPNVFIEKTLPSLMVHLKNYDADARKRDDQGDYWWELRQCAYYSEFEKEKIMWQELAQGSQFAFDDRGEFFVSNTAYILTGNRLKYILGYLNSALNEFTFEKWYCTKLGQKGTRWLNQHVVEIPVPPITSYNESLVTQIELLVYKIIAVKKQNHQSNTSALEREIDNLVYKLYDLTPAEINIIEGNIEKG
jgi:type II restriction/modification system DNA methylase subunit YeeA